MMKQQRKQAQPSPTVGPVTNRLRTESHRERIMDELTEVGVTWYGRHKLVSKYLPNIIHDDEHVKGAVYGNSEAGSVMLIATDRRVIYLDKKPFFVNEDELTYDVVSGVRHWHVGFMTTITLHSRIRDYTIDTTNEVAANTFVSYIEQRCLEHEAERSNHDHQTSKW